MQDPVPLKTPKPYKPFRWQTTDAIRFEIEDTPINIDLAQVLASRRSTRIFSQLSIPRLGNLLWQTCRSLESLPSQYGFDLLRRPYPSAGSIHPIHILIFHPELLSWTLYNSYTHCLEFIDPPTLLNGLCQRFEEFIPTEEGTLIAFAAEPGLTAAKYEHPDSLIWRDAGILQGTLALAAHALDIGLCLLGGTGEPWISGLSKESRLIGVGMAVLGGRPG